VQTVPEIIEVPAGTYEVLHYTSEVIPHINVQWEKPRSFHEYYVDGIGKTRGEYFYFTAPENDIIIRKLIRYKVD